MPLIPNSSVNVNTTPGADAMIPVDATLAVADTAEDFATIPVGKKGRNISLVNMGPGKAYIRADADATTNLANSFPLEVGDAYSDADLAVATRWSFIGEAGTQPRIRGMVWAGAN